MNRGWVFFALETRAGHMLHETKSPPATLQAASRPLRHSSLLKKKSSNLLAREAARMILRYIFPSQLAYPQDQMPRATQGQMLHSSVMMKDRSKQTAKEKSLTRRNILIPATPLRSSYHSPSLNHKTWQQSLAQIQFDVWTKGCITIRSEKIRKSDKTIGSFSLSQKADK